MRISGATRRRLRDSAWASGIPVEPSASESLSERLQILIEPLEAEHDDELRPAVVLRPVADGIATLAIPQTTEPVAARLSG
jgi:hypothetical protein